MCMKNESVRLTVSYAAVQFFFWFVYGTALAYASPYLLDCGILCGETKPE